MWFGTLLDWAVAVFTEVLRDEEIVEAISDGFSDKDSELFSTGFSNDDSEDFSEADFRKYQKILDIIY